MVTKVKICKMRLGYDGLHYLHWKSIFIYNRSSRFVTLWIDNYTYDFQGCQLFHQHPLFNSNTNALQLIAYYDDVETSNPYRIKHKLGMLLFMNVYMYIM